MNVDADTSALGMMTLLAAVLALAVYVWMALALGAVFRKIGEEQWKAWVPVYNLATLFRHGGFSPWLVLLVFVPIAGLVVFVLVAHRVGRGFGYGAGVTVVAALAPPVWASIIGFGPARWLGASGHRWGADAAGPAGSTGAAPGPGAFPPPAAAFPSASAGSAPPPPPPGIPSVPGVVPPAPALPAAFVPASAFPPPPVRVSDGPVPGSWAPPAPPVGAATHAPGERGADDALTATVASTGSDIDEVSAISPSPFEPSPASSSIGRDAMPPVSERIAPLPFTPLRRSAIPPDEPETTPAVPDEHWAPRRSTLDPLGTTELSDEVSAVAGAPVAGVPISASGAVPLQADDDAADDRTVLARRKRVVWRLVPVDGEAVEVTADVAILGRRPSDDPAFPGAQLIDVPDGGRTVSKTHARLERRGDGWLLTDLGSTNGVLVRGESGDEVEATAPVHLAADQEFLLGDERFRLTRP